jgi:hypothetical protein
MKKQPRQTSQPKRGRPLRAEKPSCRHRLSKAMPRGDRDLPGERGDCEQRSLTQGSE